MKYINVTDGALILSDSGSSVNNGVGKFVAIFEQHLNSFYGQVIVVDPVSFLKFLSKADNKSLVRYDLYVNAYNSESDFLINSKLKKQDTYNSIISKKIIVSHGWTRMKLRLNTYSIYYYIKYQILNTRSMNSIIQSYDEVLFINNEEDRYRHKDKSFVVSNNISFSYYDFASDYIAKLRKSIDGQTADDVGILIIANKQPVKNLYSLFMPGFHLWRLGQGFHKTTLLCQSCTSSWVLPLLCRLFKIELITDNSRKINLLSRCQILYIPSHTEYQPLTALEAFAFNKEVVSRNYITGLKGYDRYRYRRV
jgi:hypothetical protein